MTYDLHKRLEEAARKFKGTYLENLNIVRELKGKEPLSADDELIDLCLDVAELAYKEGAEWMFKECGGETILKEMRQTILGQCKEWLKENTYNKIIKGDLPDDVEEPDCCTLYSTQQQLFADFEADMNKLWEGKK